MAHNEGKYKEVKILPPGALTVKEYETFGKITSAGIYKALRQLRDKKVKWLKFQIVVWKGRNYVVPRTKDEIELLKMKYAKKVKKRA